MPDPTMPLPAANEELLYPEYWLVSALEWQGDGPAAEAAVAVAPGLIPRDAVGKDANQVLGCADLYAQKHGRRVIFLSDLTRMLAEAGTSWVQLRVDWESALRELQQGQFPAMYLAVSELAYLIICDPTGGAVPMSAAAGESVDERELVRRAIAGRLASDWSKYMRSAAAAGHFVLA